MGQKHQVRGLATRYSDEWCKTARGPVALLVGRDLEFGRTRQFVTLTDGLTDREIRIFRDREEAVRWLLRDRPGG